MNRIRAWARRVRSSLGERSPLIVYGRPIYNLLLDVLSSRRGVPTAFNGHEILRIDPWVRHHFPEAKDPEVFAYLRQRVRPGSICVNIGAHVGLFAMSFALWTGPRGRVIAFEPNPHTRHVLARHVRLNGLSGRVDIMPYAVSDQLGRLSFVADGLEGTSRLGIPNPHLPAPKGKPITVSVVTLDSVCAAQGIRPDWVLVDVEGFELPVLRGAAASIGPKTGLLVEFHPSLWPTASTTAEQVREWVRASGRQVVPLQGQQDAFTEHGVVALEPCES